MATEPIPIGRGLDDAADLLLNLVDQQREIPDTNLYDYIMWGESFMTLTDILREAAAVIRTQVLTYPQRVRPGWKELEVDMQAAALKVDSVYTKFGETRALADQFVAMVRSPGGRRDPEGS